MVQDLRTSIPSVDPTQEYKGGNGFSAAVDGVISGSLIGGVLGQATKTGFKQETLVKGALLTESRGKWGAGIGAALFAVMNVFSARSAKSQFEETRDSAVQLSGVANALMQENTTLKDRMKQQAEQMESIASALTAPTAPPAMHTAMPHTGTHVGALVAGAAMSEHHAGATHHALQSEHAAHGAEHANHASHAQHTPEHASQTSHAAGHTQQHAHAAHPEHPAQHAAHANAHISAHEHKPAAPAAPTTRMLTEGVEHKTAHAQHAPSHAAGLQ